MRTIHAGEEVRFQGQRWVVSRIEPGRSSPYRLLRTTPEGAEVEWTAVEHLSRIDSYVRSVEDTATA